MWKINLDRSHKESSSLISSSGSSSPLASNGRRIPRPEQQEVKGAAAFSLGPDIDSVAACGFGGKRERHARA